MNYSLLIISLPTDNSAGRMRSWRALKASGAAVLRDGVYILPERDTCLAALRAVRDDVEGGGGLAYLLRVAAVDALDWSGLFVRDADYAALLQDIEAIRHSLATEPLPGVAKKLNKLRKAFLQIVAIDFFPNAAQQQVQTALLETEQALHRLLNPDEPMAVAGVLAPLLIKDYQAKLWATRRRPWVDRLACAWLIRRFIDPDAQFMWLASPAECPQDALGFDFDGAAFTHVGDYVTFEVLVKRFQLADPALTRMAALVHYLDAGGVPPSEAKGVASVLKGLTLTLADDDELLTAAQGVFDGLLAAFTIAEE